MAAEPGPPEFALQTSPFPEPIYSVRVSLGWRALGLREGDAIFWFWIGSHADYARLLQQS